jgi:hypothetical protein
VLKWLAAITAAIVGLSLSFLFLVSARAIPTEAGTGQGGGPSTLALADIPPGYLALYMSAAPACPGLPWGVLAGIGKVESDHGQSHAPGVHSGANYAGAEGPMQFEPATFAQYAVDGDHDGKLSVYDAADAIFTAAAMLCANGAASGTPAGIRQAVFAYNHSGAYVTGVLAWAARYTLPAVSSTAVAAIKFALRQVGKPYQWEQPARTPMTAPAWSSPPTPRLASASRARPSAGAATARRSRCPRSSLGTCCSRPAPMAPQRIPATS